MTSKHPLGSPPEAQHTVEAAADAAGFPSSAFDFLSFQANPLTANDRVLSEAEVVRLLTDFSKFSEALPSLLTGAHDALSDEMPVALKYEILLNLSEELGYVGADGDWFGVSHYKILCSQIWHAFGVDVSTREASPHTQRFLADLRKAAALGNHLTFGALVALEVSAIPEITLIREIVDRRLARERRPWPPVLRRFFDVHISEFEVQHSNRLLALAGATLPDASQASLATGCFLQVADVMSDWWKQLAAAE